MKNHFLNKYAYGLGLFLVLMLGIAESPRASVPLSKDPVSMGWSAYDAGRFEEAAQIWRELAEQGNVEAQINMGMMYDEGKGVSTDPVMAVKWHRAAALEGNSGAQYYLGLMHTLGRGVACDIDQAAEWFYKAALQDLPMAQVELGLLYSQGLRVRNHNWQPDFTVSPGPQSAVGEAGDGVFPGRELAVRWIYKAGVTYLSLGDSKSAWQTVRTIRDLAGSHPLATRLEREMRRSIAGDRSRLPVRSFAGASIGTAWPIAAGYVVTNNHVVEDGRQVVLINKLGQEIPAWTVVRDAVNDVALLEVGDVHKLPPAIPLSNSLPGKGDSVFTVGFPRIDVLGETPKRSEGIISHLNGLRDDPLSYRTTVPIQPGNSGGPLVNLRGEAVGVVKAMIGVRDESSGTLRALPNASCALKIECVKELTRLLPQKQLLIPTLAPDADNLTLLAEQVQDSVLIVVTR